MDELDNLTKALGIHEDFDLLGQSWGGKHTSNCIPKDNRKLSPGMLAAEYAASRTPKGLKRLIIANSPASIALFSQSLDLLLSRFPEEFVQNVRKHEADGTIQSKEYMDATMTFLKKHMCTVDPWPEEQIQSFTAVKTNPAVHLAMYVYSFASCTLPQPFNSGSLI